jgi:hypothetical protein
MMHPLMILQARAEARAMLYGTGEFDLEEALAPLLSYALKSGVVDELGAERSFAIIKTAFAKVAEL